MSNTITVMGGFITDLMTRALRLPETGEMVKGSTFRIWLGGKGSDQAVAARRTSVEAIIANRIGDDHSRQPVQDNLAAGTTGENG